MVVDDGSVENRLTLPPGLPPSALPEASNFLNARLAGRTLGEAEGEIETALTQAAPNWIAAQRLIDDGIASWSGGEGDDRQLIVRGRANLWRSCCAGGSGAGPDAVRRSREEGG